MDYQLCASCGRFCKRSSFVLEFIEAICRKKCGLTHNAMCVCGDIQIMSHNWFLPADQTRRWSTTSTTLQTKLLFIGWRHKAHRSIQKITFDRTRWESLQCSTWRPFRRGRGLSAPLNLHPHSVPTMHMPPSLHCVAFVIIVTRYNSLWILTLTGARRRRP